MHPLHEPILIIGAARSGTALLGSIMKLHPEVAYLAEPNYIWKYSNAWMRHDMIPPSRATPEVRRFIRERFAAHCEAAGKSRFCGKTPANSFRLPFVMQVLPDARVIHLVRNGRDVSASARKKSYGDAAKISRVDTNEPAARARRFLNVANLPVVIERARQRLNIGVPARDALYHLPHFARSALTLSGLKRRQMWGPRLPGMRQLYRSHSDIELAGLQWRTSVETVLNYRANHPEMRFLQLKYEDLCANPVDTARQVYAFCDLDFSASVEERVRGLFAQSSKISHLKLRLSEEEERLLGDQIAHTLQTLGYDSPAPAALPRRQVS